MGKYRVEFTHADDVTVEADSYTHDQFFVTFSLAGNWKTDSFRTAEVRAIRQEKEGQS